MQSRQAKQLMMILVQPLLLQRPLLQRPLLLQLLQKQRTKSVPRLPRKPTLGSGPHMVMRSAA
jgi:hypothetical protein